MGCQVSRRSQIADPNRVKKADNPGQSGQTTLQDNKKDESSTQSSKDKPGEGPQNEIKPKKIVEGRRMSQMNGPIIKVHQQPVLQIKIEPFSAIVIKNLNLEYKNLYLGKKGAHGEFIRFQGDHIKENTEIFLKVEELTNFAPLDNRYHPQIDFTLKDLETKEVKLEKKNIVQGSLTDSEITNLLVPITLLNIKASPKFYSLNILIEDDKNNIKSIIDIEYTFHVVSSASSEIAIWDNVTDEIVPYSEISGVNILYQGLKMELLEVLDGTKSLDVPMDLTVGTVPILRMTNVQGLNFNHGKANVGVSALILREDGEEIIRIQDSYLHNMEGIKETAQPEVDFHLDVDFEKFIPGNKYNLSMRVWDKNQPVQFTLQTLLKIKDSAEAQAKITDVHKSGHHYEIKMHGLNSFIKDKDLYIMVEEEDEKFLKKHLKKIVKIDWEYDQFFDTKDINILKIGQANHDKKKYCWRMINVEEIS